MQRGWIFWIGGEIQGKSVTRQSKLPRGAGIVHLIQVLNVNPLQCLESKGDNNRMRKAEIGHFECPYFVLARDATILGV